MKLFVSEKAKRDLLRIDAYLAQRNPNVAEAIAHRIDRKLDQLLRFPFIARERSSLASGLRSVVVGNYLVSYVVRGDLITIVRVIDGRMDIDEEFLR